MGRVWVSCGERERLRMSHIRNKPRQGQGKKQKNETGQGKDKESHRFTLGKLLFCLLMFS